MFKNIGKESWILVPGSQRLNISCQERYIAFTARCQKNNACVAFFNNGCSKCWNNDLERNCVQLEKVLYARYSQFADHRHEWLEWPQTYEFNSTGPASSIAKYCFQAMPVICIQLCLYLHTHSRCKIALIYQRNKSLQKVWSNGVDRN